MDCVTIGEKIEELEKLVAYQKKCIEMYEQDEFDTSDRMEKVVLKCYDLTEELEYYRALLGRSSASDRLAAYLFQTMQKERNDAIARYQKAERKLARIHSKEVALREILDELDQMTYENRNFRDLYEEAKAKMQYATADAFDNEVLMEDAG